MSRLYCVFLLALLTIVTLNLYVDPAHLIKSGARGSDEFKIAQIVLGGKHAVVQKDRIGFDERLTRRIIFEGRKKADSSVIFGSSRVRYFSGAAFNELSHFVDATNAATLEDLLVFTYFRQQFHLLPKRLYIALDPWMIEKANSYTRLVELSYQDAFVRAVDKLRVSLPQSSRHIYNSAAISRLLSIPLKSEPLKTRDTRRFQTFEEIDSGVSELSGTVQISFDALIETGTFYWAWRVLVNQSVVDSGSYLDGTQNSPSPHEFRTMMTKPLHVNHGDRISVELAHATGSGLPQLKGTQRYQFKNFAIKVKCEDAAAMNIQDRADCDSILPQESLTRSLMLGKEMISPAYFQQSLKTISIRLGASAIAAKSGCTPEGDPTTWVVCEDGSLPWPNEESYDSKKVESIVRTVDDRLVPLKEADEAALKMLGQITDFYRKKGTVVKYLLVPVHPFSYGKWAAENDSRGFLRAERIYRDFAKENGVTIAGSFDPNIVGCRNTDFRDWVHPLPRCTNLIARELLEETTRQR